MKHWYFGCLTLLLVLQGFCLCHAVCHLEAGCRHEVGSCQLSLDHHHHHSHPDHHDPACALFQSDDFQYTVFSPEWFPEPAATAEPTLPIALRFSRLSELTDSERLAFSAQIPSVFLLKHAFRC